MEIRTQGRAERDLAPVMVRALTGEDLSKLEEEKGSTPPSLMKRLSERHHALARNIASGMPDYEAAAITGYSPSRISILKSDPTFKELVHFYREKVDAKYADLHERLAGLSLDAARILQERMEEAPEKITDGHILEIMKSGADRTGYGPATRSDVNVNVNIADRLQAARKRVAARTIEGEVTEVSDVLTTKELVNASD